MIFLFCHLRWCNNGWASNILIVHHSKYPCLSIMTLLKMSKPNKTKSYFIPLVSFLVSDLQQSTESSSELSPQSSSSSHTQCSGTQRPLRHWKWLDGHVKLAEAALNGRSDTTDLRC